MDARESTKDTSSSSSKWWLSSEGQIPEQVRILDKGQSLDRVTSRPVTECRQISQFRLILGNPMEGSLLWRNSRLDYLGG